MSDHLHVNQSLSVMFSKIKSALKLILKCPTFGRSIKTVTDNFRLVKFVTLGGRAKRKKETCNLKYLGQSLNEIWKLPRCKVIALLVIRIYKIYIISSVLAYSYNHNSCQIIYIHTTVETERLRINKKIC